GATAASAHASAFDAVSQGVSSTNAGAWQAAGFNGQGVTVAVIDSGFKDLSAVSNVTLAGQYCSDVNSSVHGSAVADIVREMAPHATILLYCADTATQLATAAAAAARPGAR